jgi:hypothetical protein
MKSTRLSVVAIALSTLVAGHALAADPAVGKTREQVRAELAQAQRNGDLIANGESGLRFNQLYPQQYAQPVVVSKSRSQVQGELEEARDSGTLIADGQTGATARELAPQRYAAQRKTREEVRAEVREALRNGSLQPIGNDYPVN